MMACTSGDELLAKSPNWRMKYSGSLDGELSRTIDQGMDVLTPVPWILVPYTSYFHRLRRKVPLVSGDPSTMCDLKLCPLDSSCDPPVHVAEIAEDAEDGASCAIHDQENVSDDFLGANTPQKRRYRTSWCTEKPAATQREHPALRDCRGFRSFEEDSENPQAESMAFYWRREMQVGLHWQCRRQSRGACVR